MKEAYTSPVVIKSRASDDLGTWLKDNFSPKTAAVIADENTYPIMREKLPKCGLNIILESGCIPDDKNTDYIINACKSKFCGQKPSILIACGAGTIHDLTRHAGHIMKIPFISYPTAASVDGFISGIAAITVGGRKITFPSTPPVALFADTDVYSKAPASLTSSGICDVAGKYISLFDWRAGQILTGEEIDNEIYALQSQALYEVMNCEPNDPDYHEKVMRALVTSGLVIQYMGNSRPASGAEHHLSHLWEMHIINGETPALHGEKVGVATLIMLKYYHGIKKISYKPDSDYLNYEKLSKVFGNITQGIIEENTPLSLNSVTSDRVNECGDEILDLIKQLPDESWMRDFLIKHGCKTELSQIGLPSDEQFINKTLKYAPYVRNRLTLLKLMMGS